MYGAIEANPEEPPADMAHGASWKGSPRIKGYSNMQRMAMLTFSLVGLQYVFVLDISPALGLMATQVYLGGRNDM